jgi:hypothetical protein
MSSIRGRLKEAYSGKENKQEFDHQSSQKRPQKVLLVVCLDVTSYMMSMASDRYHYPNERSKKAEITYLKYILNRKKRQKRRHIEIILGRHIY